MTQKIGVNPSRVFGLQKDYGEKAHTAMDKNDEQFFDAFEAFLKASYHQKNELIEKVLGRKSGEKSFVVGEVFQHRNPNLALQHHGDNFKSLLAVPAKDRVLSIDVFGKNNLKKYVLPKNMDDIAIQNATTSTPILEDQFWVMLYLLIIDPKLGKKILKYELRKDKVYIFHVRIAPNKVVAVVVDLVCADGGWRLNACAFGTVDWWYQEYVFLYPVHE